MNIDQNNLQELESPVFVVNFGIALRIKSIIGIFFFQYGRFLHIRIDTLDLFNNRAKLELESTVLRLI